jgi:receptor protein-tyrosine kinase
LTQPRRPPRGHLVERALDALGPMLPETEGGTPPRPASAPPASPAASPPSPGPQPAEARQPEAVGAGATLPRPEPAPAAAAPAAPAASAPAAPEAAPKPAAAPARPGPITLEAMRQAGLALAPGSVRNQTMEEVAIVQQQVIRSMLATPAEPGRCSHAVLVTSALPGEGKSFCSLNIAASIAGRGASPVVLVDADAKPAALSELLGVVDRPGLWQLANETMRNPAGLLLPTEIDRLFILPSGVQRDQEAPQGAQLAAAVLRLGAALPRHVLIVDSPPCLATSDASALAAVAGQVVMVVQAERTKRAEVEASLDLVDACPTLQLLLNQARMGGAGRFGGYGYGYGYGYGARPDAG